MNDSTLPGPLGHEDQPLDLHALYRMNADCGYTDRIDLPAHTASSIAASLRGIRAITAILLVATDTDVLTLGEWLQSGLVEAVDSLADGICTALEQGKERSQTTHQTEAHQ